MSKSIFLIRHAQSYANINENDRIITKSQLQEILNSTNEFCILYRFLKNERDLPRDVFDIFLVDSTDVPVGSIPLSRIMRAH